MGVRHTLEFQTGDEEKFGSGLVHFQHQFTESGLFSDAELAALIERYPREYYLVNTIFGSEDAPDWRSGTLDGLSGEAVLEAVRAGRLWLCMRRLDLVAPKMDALVEAAFAEMAERNPGLVTNRHKSSLLISSPGARVLYHADIPMVALWHVRGRKRVWIYDANCREMLPDEVLESVVLREREEEIPYDPSWDAKARAVDLEPGWALSWPHNTPHRVDNLDGLNVSITTDFFTPDAQRKYGVYFANGLARRKLGISPRSTNTAGVGALGKCAAAVAMKKMGVHRSRERDLIASFVLDPDNPGQVIELPEQERSIIVQS